MTTLPSMTAQEKQWQAESDARTLAESQVIMKDPKRLAAAAKKAQEIAKKQAQDAKAMEKVASKAPIKASPKPSAPKASKKAKKGNK